MNALLTIEPSIYQHDHARLLAGIRQTHDMEKAASDIPLQWQQFMQFKAGLENVITGQDDVSYGVICAGNSSGFEYMCAAEVNSFADVPGDCRLKLQDQQYAVFVHNGNISDIKSVWQGVWQWVESSNYKVAEAPCFEKYDQRFDAQTGEGGFEVWVPLISF